MDSCRQLPNIGRKCRSRLYPALIAASRGTPISWRIPRKNSRNLKRRSVMHLPQVIWAECHCRPHKGGFWPCFVLYKVTDHGEDGVALSSPGAGGQASFFLLLPCEQQNWSQVPVRLMQEMAAWSIKENKICLVPRDLATGRMRFTMVHQTPVWSGLWGLTRNLTPTLASNQLTTWYMLDAAVGPPCPLFAKIP